MSKSEAMKLVMNATRTAMREFDLAHRGEEIDPDARLHWINGYLTAAIPAEVRRLAS